MRKIRTYKSIGIAILITILLVMSDAVALETVRGVIRQSSDFECAVNCGTFYLDPDPTYSFTILQGNFRAYDGYHVEITGFRDYCNGCFAFVVTEPIKFLPPLVPVEDVSNAIPTQIRLYQNYPNPFNPATKITFTIPVRSHVTLTIINLLGQEVETLINQEMSPGVYHEIWEAVRQSGGVYFYQLRVRNTVQNNVINRRMILLR